MTIETHPLAGKGIVVTRPAHQSAHLVGLIAAAGGTPILFPTIEIAAIEDQGPLSALIARLDEFDIAIFVSPNAANVAMTLIRKQRLLPAHLKLATIGSGGVRELEKHGISEVIAPRRFDSEALLDMPEIRNVAGLRIVIFRGRGGRELLGDTLSARGARVEYAECYQRRVPKVRADVLLQAWERQEIHSIIATSSEGVRNLFVLVDDSGLTPLKQTSFFVPHPRIAQTARALGVAEVVQTGQGDEELVRGLVSWHALHR
jgi:uroporphyrinogen-III synthase